VIWGIVIGILQGATPLAFWWLDDATVYALGLAVIAAIYIGFAVADGRSKVIAVESGVASGFVIIAAAAVTGTAWLLVIGLAGHGLKDLWQHRTQFVANTRWWPPFCMVVDFVVAAIIVVEIAAGMNSTDDGADDAEQVSPRNEAVRLLGHLPGALASPRSLLAAGCASVQARARRADGSRSPGPEVVRSYGLASLPDFTHALARRSSASRARASFPCSCSTTAR